MPPPSLLGAPLPGAPKARDDPYDGYKAAATATGIEFTVPKSQSVALMFLKYTVGIGLACLVIGQWVELLLGAGFMVFVAGFVSAVITANVRRNLGKFSIVELRPDAIVVDRARSFRREDIRSVAFEPEKDRPTYCMKIIYGVKEIVLADQIERLTSSAFKTDFEKARRRLWYMLD